MRNSVIDLRFRGLLVGREPSRYEHLGAHAIENSDYRALDHVFAGRLAADDVLVDVGCGRGRVINWWLHNGYRDNRIYGLERDPEVAARTRARLARYPNVTIITGDAVETLPPDATLLYLYNPFEANVVAELIGRAKTTYRGRRLRLLYYHCKHVSLFQSDPAWSVEIRRVGEPGPAPFDDVAVIELAAP